MTGIFFIFENHRVKNEKDPDEFRRLLENLEGSKLCQCLNIFFSQNRLL